MASHIGQTNHAPAIGRLNALLRGEISAVETYSMVVKKFSGSVEKDMQGQALKRLMEDHGRAAQAIRQQIVDLGGAAADSSGPWGTVAEIVQGAANLFSHSAALKALREGEHQGLRDCRDAIASQELPRGTTMLIEGELIPSIEQHIQTLDRMIAASRHGA